MKSVVLVFFLLSSFCQIEPLKAQESQKTKEKKSLDVFSFNSFIIVFGNNPIYSEHSIPLQVKDPYKKPNTYWNKQLEKSEKNYCGIKIDTKSSDYKLRTFSKQSDLFESGFHITHKGSCGTCSTAKDLKVYLEKPNLTSPVRKCAALSFRWPVMQCLLRLGFTRPCAETWYYNIAQTRRKCSTICIKSWWKDENFNGQDGSLNSCLACDEKEAGPAFKVTAGRTRRRSGIVSAIKRKDQEFYRLKHDYLKKIDTDKRSK
ncbi:MAG: hypothetical protein AB8G05_24705 [Oligoflexales bacterium]